MQQDVEQSAPAGPDEDTSLWTHSVRRRVLLGLIALLCIVLLVVVPPYFSISRYQRRVAAAISGALGRPVHFDNITLHLLPVPGLTISNFVVSEAPEFGAEPVLRANSVEARLRVSSLWRRRLEVARISLDSPSINLVRRRADGRWNLQGILQEASQMHSAPTAQQRASDAPRFPYIEATDARINIKSDLDKLPFSVKEAEFALWLPEPDQWRLRIVGKPVRTDTDVNDVGLLRVEATLGRAGDLSNAAIDVAANWKPTPLGEAAKLTAGYDLGWRGEASASATLRGTLQTAKLVTDWHLSGLHRADFLPPQNADVEAHCEAAAAGLLRSLHDLRCAVPTDTSLTISSLIDALRRLPEPNRDSDMPETTRPGVLLVRAEVPNVLDWRTASGTASLTDASAQYAAVWARLFLQSIPVGMQVGGKLNLSASIDPAAEQGRQWTGVIACRCILPRPAADTAAIAGEKASPVQNVTGQRAPNLWSVALHHDGESDSPAGFRLSAFPVVADPGSRPEAAGADVADMEAAEPARADLPVAGEITRSGYLLRYRSISAVRQVAAVVPALGQGVPADAVGPVAASGDWYRPPVWIESSVVEHPVVTRRHHRRR